MIKPILSAAALSLMIVSTAWALPVSQATLSPLLSSTDVIQVGHGRKNYNKNYNKHYNYKHYNYKHDGRYYYRNRYWATATRIVPTTGRRSAASSSVRCGTARSL